MVNKTVLEWDSLSHHCRNLYIGTVSYLIGGFRCGHSIDALCVCVYPFSREGGINPFWGSQGFYSFKQS